MKGPAPLGVIRGSVIFLVRVPDKTLCGSIFSKDGFFCSPMFLQLSFKKLFLVHLKNWECFPYSLKFIRKISHPLKFAQNGLPRRNNDWPLTLPRQGHRLPASSLFLRLDDVLEAQI